MNTLNPVSPNQALDGLLRCAISVVSDEELKGSTKSSYTFLANGLCIAPGPPELEAFANLAARDAFERLEVT